MPTIAITITAQEPEQEILISLLSDLGAEGFQQTDNELVAYFFSGNYSGDELNEVLKPYEFEKTVMPDQNWNALWESNFEPIQIGDFCVVRAEFHPFVPQTTFDLIITPKMSFGTGHHATTYMMIEQMAAIDFKDKRVLDFGAGTGILAILAEKMGAVAVNAIDNDILSIENAMENLQKNACLKVSVVQLDTPPGGIFDIILANINRNTILEHISALYASLANDGLLLVSGLLEADEDDMMTAFRGNAFRYLKGKSRSGWISLLFG